MVGEGSAEEDIFFLIYIFFLICKVHNKWYTDCNLKVHYCEHVIHSHETPEQSVDKNVACIEDENDCSVEICSQVLETIFEKKQEHDLKEKRERK